MQKMAARVDSFTNKEIMANDLEILSSNSVEKFHIGSREEFSFILRQQITAGRETGQIRKEGEAIWQEVSAGH